MTTFFSLRSEWDSADDPCHKKLPLELWTLMKAEGSAQNADAQYVRESCIQTQDVGLVELITPKGFTVSDKLEAAPGEVVSETEHASTYRGATAISFEAFCEDDNISKVTRVKALLETRTSPQREPRRRLQATTSEAGQAHQVAELITGLAELGCSRTTGEDQTVCVLSDSFNANGNAEDLQFSGDLPPVEVVKEHPQTDNLPEAIDEGSAMLELMYDISSGSTYKFNTAFVGEQTFADDIGVLTTEEGCDVLVDDVGYPNEPAFRDGVIADAVGAAVDSGSLYFSSAGNNGPGYRFASDFECTTAFNDAGLLDGESESCGTGFASHVFRPEMQGIYRHFLRFEPRTTSMDEFFLHWDAAMNTDQDVVIVIYRESLLTDDVSLWSINDNFSGGFAHESAEFTSLPDNFFSIYNLQIIQYGPEIWNSDFLLFSESGFPIAVDANFGGSVAGSIYGHACASSCVAVAAMDWAEGDGSAGAFEDPETSAVESFSSRGPCLVDGDTRSKPTTTAADRLTTSTPDFESFPGTSAAAPVAAAIATIIRAACFPKVVGYAEILEMLTNYDYTIDYTNDAGGAAETWGSEAGNGIISASQMLAWVAANCGAACPGAESAPTPEPAVLTPGPVPVLDTPEPTPSPASTPTTNPTSTPIEVTPATEGPAQTPVPSEAPEPTTPSPTDPLTAPTSTPIGVATPAPAEPPTGTPGPSGDTPELTPSPASPPTTAPASAPIANTPSPEEPATRVPSGIPGPTTPSPESPPTAGLTTAPAPTTDAPVPTAGPPSPTQQPPALPPTSPPSASRPTASPVDQGGPTLPPSPEEDYVEVGTKTSVAVTATAWDERPGGGSGGVGCGEDGCLPELAHDGIGEEDVESRWSCAKTIVPDGGQCQIEFAFGSPQDIKDVVVDFWKGDERTRTLKVKVNGSKVGEFDSDAASVSTSLGIAHDGVHVVTLESIGIGQHEWISLLEVRFMVEP